MKHSSPGAAIGLLMIAGCSQPSKPLVAGSKLTVESSVLGEILAQHIQNTLGVSVGRRAGMMGTVSAHQALLSGEIDLYAEDSGTAYYSIFRLPASKDPDLLNSRVALEYQNLGIRWMAPLGYLSTYVVAASAAKVNASTLSGLADGEFSPTISYTLEFSDRLDGFAAMMAGYKLKLSGSPRVVEPNLVAAQLTQQLSHIAVVGASDPVLLNVKCKVLEDDKKMFTGYPAAIVVKERTLATNPHLEGALKRLEGKLPLETIRNLNNGVVTLGKSPAAVAAEFLHQAGLK